MSNNDQPKKTNKNFKTTWSLMVIFHTASPDINESVSRISLQIFNEAPNWGT